MTIEPIDYLTLELEDDTYIVKPSFGMYRNTDITSLFFDVFTEHEGIMQVGGVIEASTNISFGHVPDDEHIIVKEAGCNKGMIDALIMIGFIDIEPVNRLNSSYEILPVHKLTP